MEKKQTIRHVRIDKHNLSYENGYLHVDLKSSHLVTKSKAGIYLKYHNIVPTGQYLNVIDGDNSVLKLTIVEGTITCNPTISLAGSYKSMEELADEITKELRAAALRCGLDMTKHQYDLCLWDPSTKKLKFIVYVGTSYTLAFSHASTDPNTYKLLGFNSGVDVIANTATSYNVIDSVNAIDQSIIENNTFYYKVFIGDILIANMLSANDLTAITSFAVSRDNLTQSYDPPRKIGGLHKNDQVSDIKLRVYTDTKEITGSDIIDGTVIELALIE